MMKFYLVLSSFFDKKRLFISFAMDNKPEKQIKKRLSAAEKQAAVEFILKLKAKRKKYAWQTASKEFGVSIPTLNAWVRKATTEKVLRRSGLIDKVKPAPLPKVDPKDLRRMATLMEEIATLQAQVDRLASMRNELARLQAKIFK